MTRNVLNTWDVEKFLEELRNPDDAEVVGRWLDRVARRWILKEFPVIGRVMRLHRPACVSETYVDVEWPAGTRDSINPCFETTYESLLPAWLEPALPKGVYWLDLEGPDALELAIQLEAVMTCFRSLPPKKLERIERISLPDAISMAARSRVSGLLPDNTLMRFSDGYRIAVLGTAKELELEGQRMNHCVASYADSLDDGIEILSLRDAKDRPHVTMEVDEGLWLDQVKGKGNSAVAEPYRQKIAALIDELGLTIRGDQELVGITSRSFCPNDPESWRNQPCLARSIRQDIAGHPSRGFNAAVFYGDLSAEMERFDEATWSWMTDLFRGPDGALAWPDPSSSFDIAGHWFFVVAIRFPHQLYWRLGGKARSQTLERQMLQDLERLIVRFCRRDDRTLIAHMETLEHVHRDLEHLRRCHKERIRRRFDRVRRGLSRRSMRKNHSEKTLALWEKNAEKFARRLEDQEGAYI